MVERDQDMTDDSSNEKEIVENIEEEEELRAEDADDSDIEDTKSEDANENVNSENIKTEDAGIETEEGNSQEGEEEPEGDSEGTEALSRNVTRYYEVERGDTLYTICQEIYGDISQVEKICELNDITDPDQIRFGQKIILP